MAASVLATSDLPHPGTPVRRMPRGGSRPMSRALSEPTARPRRPSQRFSPARPATRSSVPAVAGTSSSTPSESSSSILAVRTRGRSAAERPPLCKTVRWSKCWASARVRPRSASISPAGPSGPALPARPRAARSATMLRTRPASSSSVGGRSDQGRAAPLSSGGTVRPGPARTIVWPGSAARAASLTARNATGSAQSIWASQNTNTPGAVRSPTKARATRGSAVRYCGSMPSRARPRAAVQVHTGRLASFATRRTRESRRSSSTASTTSRGWRERKRTRRSAVESTGGVIGAGSAGDEGNGPAGGRVGVPIVRAVPLDTEEADEDP